MNARWQRGLAGLGLALAGTLLTGCHAQGTFDVLSDERVAVDLTVSGADVSCPNSADALKLTVTTVIDQFGDEVCHVTGETQATYFSPFGIDVSRAAEYLVLQVNLSGGTDSWPTADIEVRFPGAVASASQGVISDNVVRVTDLGALTQGSGLHAVALRSSSPRGWLIAAVAGAGAGITLTLIVGAVVTLVRRSRGQPPASLEDFSFPDPAADPSSPVPAPVAASTPAPVSATSAGPPRSPPDDQSWFARPPATNTGGVPAVNGARASSANLDDPASSPAVQHAVWARPSGESRPSGSQAAD